MCLFSASCLALVFAFSPEVLGLSAHRMSHKHDVGHHDSGGGSMMDMSGGGGMQMYFSATTAPGTVLFQTWQVTTGTSYAVACLVLAAVCVLKEYLYSVRIQRGKLRAASGSGSGSRQPLLGGSASSRGGASNSGSSSLLLRGDLHARLLDTAIYGLNLALGFSVMVTPHCPCC
jgi:hypothetical protein